MKIDLYKYNNYRRYLADLLDTEGFGRGSQAKLAKALGCGSSFISQVLKENHHFSLEQGQNVAAFLGLDGTEQYYFLLLIQLDKAGTRALRNVFAHEVKTLQEKHQVVAERIGVRNRLGKDEQMIYYSSWVYAAIHILVSVPALSNVQALSEHLKLPGPLVSEVVDFLVSTGLIEQDVSALRIGKKRIHLGVDSPMLFKHHTNWRLKALESLESVRNTSNLHYSSVLALSNADAERIKSVLLDALAETEGILRDTSEENAFVLGIDFFNLKK
ncbi:MAG: TIGR02147 family protein [Pseudobdellovibrionaceae bacterium]